MATISSMTTRETVQQYYDRLRVRGDWQALFAADVEFASLTSPVKRVAVKAAFLESTRRFYASIESLDVRQLIVDGDRAAAIVRYEVRPPDGGPAFESHVAEVFSVRRGQIHEFTICFDTAPYPKR